MFQIVKLVFADRRVFVWRTVDQKVPEEVPYYRNKATDVKHQCPIIISDLEQITGRTLRDNRTDHVS